MSPLAAELQTPATASSKRARPARPCPLPSLGGESSYDDEPALPVKRRKPAVSSNPSASLPSHDKPAPKSAFDLRTADKTVKKPTAKKAPTETAITKAGKAVLEKYDAGALTAKQAADLVAYTRQLEEKAGPKKLGETQISEEVNKLQGMIRRGIEKSLTWKPSCKHNGAKFSYEGLCPDPAIMDAMLGDKPKQRKFTVEEFQENIIEEDISGSVRYATLYIVGTVNLRWNAQTGIYKFTGTYGKNPPGMESE